MEEKFELYEHVYQDSEMACYTIKELMKDLKEKDNKIKGLLEDILKDYIDFKEKAKERLKANKQEIKETGMFSKMMAGMGIKKEVKNDNSDSSMADLLIQGISMGTIDAEKKIKNYEKEVDKKQLDFLKDFLKFQENTIEKLKKYL